MRAKGAGHKRERKKTERTTNMQERRTTEKKKVSRKDPEFELVPKKNGGEI